MLGYYDAVLGLIPAVLFGLSGLLHGAGLALTSAITLSALGAVLVVGHAMFVHAPVDGVHATAKGNAGQSSGAVAE